jgi:Concanavalin A-like lectin/glucanases superfamily
MLIVAPASALVSNQGVRCRRSRFFGLPFLVLLNVGCGRLGFSANSDADVVIVDATIDVGLVAHYPMDDDPAASRRFTGIPQSASIGCTTCPTKALGRVGEGSYLYNTGGGRVVLPDSSWIGVDSYSVAVWLASSDPSADMTALAKPISIESRFNDWALGQRSRGHYIEGTEGGVDVYAQENFVVQADEWHHFVTTSDGQTRILYRDGVAVASKTGTFETSNEPTGIGADIDIDVEVNPYAGRMDDLRIYNITLSASDVQKLYARFQ